MILNNFNTFNNTTLIICGDFNLNILKTDNLNVYIKYITNKSPENLSNYKTVKREFQLNIKKNKK